MTLNKKVLMDPMKKIASIRHKLYSKENIKKHCIIFVKEYTRIIYTITTTTNELTDEENRKKLIDAVNTAFVNVGKKLRIFEDA